jgi:Pectinacetylesterase
MRNRRFLWPAAVLAASIWMVPGLAAAQPLAPALCPPGSPFNLQPTFTPFLAGQAGIPLLRRTLNLADYPDARCNDGSAAVMYIRPANAAYGGNPIVDPSRKWVIFLDGGGGCRDADECLLTRWCGGGGQVFDRAGKMSSLGAPPAIRGFGIFSLQPPAPAVNHFADYNHVLIHYCSSDNWIGSARHTGINASTGTTYDIRFEGEAIVNAAIFTLINGPVGADPGVAAAFYNTTVPNLQAASEILLGGESAGGGGLRHHLDRLYTLLQAAVADPEVQIRAVVDAGTPPGLWDPAISWADPYSPGDYPDNLLTEAQPTVRSFWGAGDSALDASCLDPVWTAAHNLVGGHPQVCYDTTYTLMNHITTPVFLRQDINDPLGKQRYVDWALYPTSDDYWSAQFSQLNLFSTYSPASGGLEAPLAPPGIQGINCSRHVAIQTNDGFYAHRVTGPGLPARSFHDLLVNWLAGAAPGVNTIQIQTDNLGAGAYTPSSCP